jgi:DNA-binding transcriptional MerR regulator
MTNLLNAKELAVLLKVTAPTIHSWHRRGLIPCLRAGQRPVLFDPAEVRAALTQRAAERREALNA